MKRRWMVMIGLILFLTAGCAGLQESTQSLVKSQAEAFLSALDTMPENPLDSLPDDVSQAELKAAAEQANEEIINHFQPVMTAEGLKKMTANRWLTPKGLEMFLRPPLGEFTPDTREIIGCDELSDGSWDCTVVCQGTEKQIRILLNLKHEDGTWKVASMRHRRAE